MSYALNRRNSDELLTTEVVMLRFKMNLKPRIADVHQNDDFLMTMNKIFSLARFIGISQCGLNIAFFWTVSVVATIFVIESVAIWKLIRLVSGWSVNASGGGLVGRLSGSIFYGNALLSLIFSLHFVFAWTKLSDIWITMNNTIGFNLPPDAKIKKRITYVTGFVTVFACVEHILSMMSATDFNIPHGEYFYRYIISSHGFLMQTYEYSLWKAIPIFIMSKVATLLWNFQDLIIILVSMGLSSRYHRLNLFVGTAIRYERKIKGFRMLGTDMYIQVQMWRKIREAYTRQAALIRLVDGKIGALVLLSNANNLYFICLQLFLGIGKESIINRLYYFLSLGWLLFRACSVVLAASDINVYSKKALIYLYSCPDSGYNVEIKRLIYQLTNDEVALSGMKLFNLNRNLLLQVAAAILKYELVLLQFDTN